MTTAVLTPEAAAACKLYQPRGAAKALFPCRDPEALIEGPAGTGKTRAVLEKVNRWMLKCPGSRGLIVRKTRASMTESVLVTLESQVIPDNTDFYPELHNQLRKTRTSYEYPNGSTLVVAGMDNPDRIMSTEYDLIAGFECTEMTEEDWENLTTRLRHAVMPFQQAIADCNPSSPSHWLNARANRPYVVPAGLEEFVPSPRPGQKQMTRLLSRHQDNPSIYDPEAEKWTARGAQYLAKLNSLTGARKLRLLKGVWAAAEGLVFPDYDPAIHLIDRFDIPKEWRRIRVVDFGLVNAFVCQFWAFDGDDRMYRYREIYMTQRLVQDHAEQIKKLSGDETFEATVSDHDAEGRATLARYGIPTVAARKDVETGIEAVSLRLRLAADKKPRLFLMRDSLVERDGALVEARLPTCTEEEFDGYVRQKSTETKAAKEEPLKLNDHGMDAMRYACMHRKIERRSGEVFLMNPQ